MKRSAVYVVLLIVVVIIVAVLCIRIFTNEAAPEPPKETQAAQTLPPTASEPVIPKETPAPPATEIPAPTEAPKETEKPFETRAPIETTEPAPEETPEPFKADGSFRSDTGTFLNLVAEWAAVNNGGDTVTLQVVLSAESYSFFTSALYNSLQLTVNGNTYSANSPEISYDGEALARTQLASFTVEVPRGTTTLEAVWHYKGSYSGTELTDITAGAVITLG